uniref:Uncharacterized protein n=1 Tax=Anguilla anguilla TaxID=7936 RepID=A0A0E9QGQ7_ANGAN
MATKIITTSVSDRYVSVE